MAVTQALEWSRWLCPAVIVLLYVIAMTLIGDPPQHETIDAAIAASTEATKEWAGNALVGEALRGLAYFHGTEAFVLGRLRAMDTTLEVWLLAVLVVGAGHFALLYNACLALSCFRIPRAAFRQAHLLPRSMTTAFSVAVVATFLPMFIFLPLLAELEPYAKEFADQRKEAEETATQIVEALIPVEQIKGDPNCVPDDKSDEAGLGCFYKQGTDDKIRIARREAAESVGVAADQFRREVDLAFARLENEAVDEYLDWYYSLPSEYGRLLMLLTGGTERLEDHLMEKANDTFGHEQWFASANTAIERLFTADEEARTAYEQALRDILERNRVEAKQAEVDVLLTKELEDTTQASFYQAFVPEAYRFGIAGVGGSAAGAGIARIVAHKVTAKMLGKSLIKLAAKVPLKALASKIGAGAVAGGTAGIIVPVAGNVVGAVAGILVGISGGVLIDGTLLKLEEVLDREEFKSEIIAAIREARLEFEEDYLGTSLE